MGRRRQVQTFVTVLLIPLLAMPLRAESWTVPLSGSPDSPIGDHALRADGTLVGKVVDSSGQPLAGQVVRLRPAGGSATETVTDSEGNFAFLLPRGGVYAVETGGVVQIRRLWTAEVAPPAAQHGPILLAASSPESPIVRAQSPQPHSGLTAYHASWILVGLLVGGAIVIAVDDDDAS
jgi:hypothetical protein